MVVTDIDSANKCQYIYYTALIDCFAIVPVTRLHLLYVAPGPRTGSFINWSSLVFVQGLLALSKTLWFMFSIVSKLVNHVPSMNWTFGSHWTSHSHCFPSVLTHGSWFSPEAQAFPQEYIDIHPRTFPKHASMSTAFQALSGPRDCQSLLIYISFHLHSLGLSQTASVSLKKTFGWL